MKGFCSHNNFKSFYHKIIKERRFNPVYILELFTMKKLNDWYLYASYYSGFSNNKVGISIKCMYHNFCEKK